MIILVCTMHLEQLATEPPLAAVALEVAETTEAGRPPRHMYKLTGDGLRCARTQGTAEGAALPDGQPAFSGVKA